MAGFLFQLARALLRLAGAQDESLVSIETLDDVVIEKPDGNKVLEQDKLSFRRNPIPNGSANFWKSLCIWIGLLDDGEIVLEKSEFQLVSSFEVKTGIAALLKLDPDKRDNKKVLSQLLKAAKNPTDEAKEYAGKVLKWPRAKLNALVSRITVTDSSCADTRLELGYKLNIDPSIRDSVIRGLIGWITDITLAHFEEEAENPGDDGLLKIHVNVFRSELNQLIAKHFSSKIVLRASQEIVASPESIDAEKNARFVKQLKILEFGESEDDMILDAILDHLRTDEETTRLADQNEVTKRKFREYQSRLRDHWKYCMTKAKLSPLQRPALTGQFVLNETMNVNATLDGQPVVHSYLNRGTLHAMADITDHSGIGWHPEFEQLLNHPNA